MKVDEDEKEDQGENGSFIVTQLLSRVQLCDPMDCSTPGFPVLHHLPELAQTHVRVSR